MNVGTISVRYAKALFEYAREQDAEQAIYNNMLQLRDVLSENKRLTLILKDPALTESDKVGLLCSVVESSPQYRRFASLVIKEGRENLLLYIAYAYIEIYREAKGICLLKVTTANKLSATMQMKIEKMAEAGNSFNVEIKNIVDPSIIGGVIIETGNKRLDASVRNQLAEIKKTLVESVRKLV